ncbi:MAG TPA: Ada metal-binding domain-containing protein [Caulobacter sp.]|nr:Ada metal-binding domain-containing protein [Caulobacter sp.]
MNPSAYPDDDARWAACLARDPAADGAFFIAVRTTKIYCRPVCPARPLRKNVVFHATGAQARAAGFRACKRCKPDLLETAA